MPELFRNRSAEIILFFCLLLSICSCPYGYAQTTLKVGVYDNKPIIFVNDDGEVQGLFVDILEEIAIKENWRLEYVVGHFFDVFAQLKGGGIDILPALAYSKQREKTIDYTSETILSNWAELYTPGDGKLTSLLELEGKKVGVMQGDIHFTALKELTDRFNISCRFIETYEYETVFEMLQANFVHVGVVNRLYGTRHKQEYSVKQTAVIFNPIELRFGATKGKHQVILTKIDSYMLRYLADGHSIYYRFIDKWLAADTKDVFPRWVFYLFIAVAGATLFFFGASLLFRRQLQRRTEELTNANSLLKSQMLERTKAENALLENEEKFRNLLESTSTVPWELDLENSKFTYMGHQIEQILGYPAASWKDMNIWAERVHPDDREESFLFFETETKKGRNHDFIYRAIHKDGSYRWIRDVVSVVMDSGIPKKIIGFMQDITEQKKMELEQKAMMIKLQQSQKMEAIGTLAGGIAHDFNNILGAILGYAEMIRDDLASDSASIQDIDQILIASNRAKELVKQILAFSRQAEANKILLQPITIIKEAIKMLRPFLPTTIKIEQDLHANAGSILADPNQFHQIILNLTTNAFHAMEMKGGTLSISLHKIELTKEDPALEPHMQPGRYLRLSIKDSGEGIKPDIKEKLFDPFFTTKEVGEGTGMGLATVHGIVQNFGGSIIFDSRLGEGTVFHVTLPTVEEQTQLDSESMQQAPQHGNERILLVDDEEMLVELGKTILERLGYSVTTCGSSLDALEIFQKRPDAFDLLITDQTMPSMTGVDLSRRILQIRPELPIILCTGYSSLISEEKAKLVGFKGFALKPLVKKDIAELIRKVLDGEK